MKYRRLGNSGILVSDLCLGTMTFGETSGRGATEKDSIKMVHHFLDEGGNHIDTANVYAGSVSEQILGKALKGKRKDVILATKVNFPLGKGINDAGLSRRHILDSVDQSLKRLNTDHIDLLYMHCWDPLTPLEESLGTFNDLIIAGKVRYIGVSNFKAWQLMKALAVSRENGWNRFVAAQYQYSLVVRDIEREFTEICQHEGIGLTPWGPLGGGFLSGKYDSKNPPKDYSDGRLGGMKPGTEEAWHRRNTEKNWEIVKVAEEIANEHKASVPQVALAWLRDCPEVSSVILGVRTMDQLKDNLGSSNVILSLEERNKLNEVSQLQEMYPYRFIQSYARKLPG